MQFFLISSSYYKSNKGEPMDGKLIDWSDWNIDAIEKYPQGYILRFRATLPFGFPEPLTPPFHEIFQHAFHRGGVDFFWNNPMWSTLPILFPFSLFFSLLTLFFLIWPYYKLESLEQTIEQNRIIIIISRLTLLGEHFPNRNRPFKLFKSQVTHTNCVTVVMFEFRGNVWEYWQGSYYRDMRWILLYKVKIDIFLPEMLCIVVFAAENGELKQFEGCYIQSFDIPIYFLLNSNITTCSHTIWVGALCPNSDH